MIKKIKAFIKGEEGYTAESLAWTTVVGLGATGVCFGLYAASRYLSAGAVDDIKAIQTPSSLPSATEQITNLKAGYTGAITGIVIE
ncbi:hypothetical protein JOC37_001312 [Desulfohalotomaculum tongense]|uniref:hypothetical protein n=1 Tax=Desulforadius tongensis TaxID=1216062 RepID=UPI00195A116C|nr:hypothetical protein [Desulforadius tongensis]MBM7854932.1 hypothetical protein [Desulforadius tongensis]